MPKDIVTQQNKITIIGGGASGMMAAISAARVVGGRFVRIIEKNDKLGRKILATGNGRCNFTNRFCTATDLYSDERGKEDDICSSFAKTPLDIFGISETLNIFESIGLFWREESEGRIYPYSEQASAVQEALLGELNALGVEINYSAVVANIKLLSKTDAAATVKTPMVKPTEFEIVLDDGSKLFASKLIVATGGKAGSLYGSTGDGYKFAKGLGHTIIKPIPALVQLTSNDKVFQQLKGVRAKGKVTLMDLHGKEIISDLGEIQFTGEGLSGICIFNLSRFLRNHESLGGEKLQHAIKIDLMPEIDKEELFQRLIRRAGSLKNRKREEFLYGIVNKKLAPVLLKKANIEALQNTKPMTEAEISRIAALLKSWEIAVSGTKGWREAQVTAGGIITSEINENNMESTIVPGLYLAGEIVDIDGKCGGYNLQWAWTSGYIAGKSAAEAFCNLEDQC